MAIQRRTFLSAGATLGVAAATNFGLLARAWAQQSTFKPEAGAQLTFLRFRRFVPAEGEAFEAILAAFTQATGVKVSIQAESIDDVQPKAAIAANTGTGPDLILGTYALPHLFPEKCLDVSEVAGSVGKAGGGWATSSTVYGRSGTKWICLPFMYTGNPVNYRVSQVKKAGFDAVPTNLDGFLELMKALKSQGTPAGMALGHATSDANNWTHWCLWTHGGTLIDQNAKVAISSPETEAALNYAKAMYAQWVPGTASWNDASNNKAFLAGELSLTNNGISIWLGAKAEKPDIAADMGHALWPVGPAGRQTSFDPCYSAVGMAYTKYPQAVKALLEFMFQPDVYNAYLQKCGGFASAPLLGFTNNPVWKDPMVAALRDTSSNTMTAGHQGPVDSRAAAALADFVVVDMFATVCTGQSDVKSAIRAAERKAARIYR
jgi:multiple sugar transport system substrate-binding protein